MGGLSKIDRFKRNVGNMVTAAPQRGSVAPVMEAFGEEHSQTRSKGGVEDLFAGMEEPVALHVVGKESAAPEESIAEDAVWSPEATKPVEREVIQPAQSSVNPPKTIEVETKVPQEAPVVVKAAETTENPIVKPKATHVLFQASKVSRKETIVLDRKVVAQQAIELVFQELATKSINLSYFGDFITELDSELYEISEIGNHQFITMSNEPSDLVRILTFVQSMKSAVDKDSYFVMPMTKKVGAGHSLTISMSDLQTISSACPEYSFGVADDSLNPEDMRLVVECLK